MSLVLRCDDGGIMSYHYINTPSHHHISYWQFISNKFIPLPPLLDPTLILPSLSPVSKFQSCILKHWGLSTVCAGLQLQNSDLRLYKYFFVCGVWDCVVLSVFCAMSLVLYHHGGYYCKSFSINWLVKLRWFRCLAIAAGLRAPEMRKYNGSLQ